MLQSAASGAVGQGKSAASNQAGKIAKSKFFKYILVALLLSALTAAAGFLVMLSPQMVHGVLLFIFLLWGILHLNQMNKHFSWAANDILAAEAWFTIIITFVAFLGFSIGFYLLNKYFPEKFLSKEFTLVLSSAVIILPIPWLLEKTFRKAISIPPPEYKVWVYPAKQLVMDTDAIDLRNFALVTFLFSKQHGEENNTQFPIKAPYQLKFGDFFYFFIQEWNHKYPGKEIQYIDAGHKPFGWRYYIKNRWWQNKRYLDPDLTVGENGISINQIIKTERVEL